MPFLPLSRSLSGKLRALYSIKGLFFLSALIAWPIFAELELFERIYDFSRTHEDWEIDEIALLIVNLSIALMFSLAHQSRQLKKLMRERKVEHDRAEQNARHDPLTGLLNRRAFSEVLDRAEREMLAWDERFVAMIDLDKFKPVNDLQGHAVGDATLQRVAERLIAEAHPGDIIARLGGDEFAFIFANGLDAMEVERSARRMITLLEEPIKIDDTLISISCSIGLAAWTSGTKGSDALLIADKALYAAKNDGRARFNWYDEDMDRKSSARAEIENDLRAAIRDGAIEPWFQPIVDIDTSRLTGFEILARWHHPKHGWVPPGVFIEIAEDSGQIGTLGVHLLRQACRSAALWHDHLSISFNLSPLQFYDPNLVSGIRDILSEAKIAPNRLTIEVTESAVISDFDSANQKLNALKDLGISVALDDFGTGYSSLASLRQLPFDRIKIDRSFVTGIRREPQNQKIVSGIMELARGLELDVTAEGIESTDDLEFLTSLDCASGQGFLFGKAISADKVSWLLESAWSGGEVDLDQPDLDVPKTKGA